MHSKVHSKILTVIQICNQLLEAINDDTPGLNRLSRPVRVTGTLPGTAVPG